MAQLASSDYALAEALWAARLSGIVVDGRFLDAELSLPSARAVAAELEQRREMAGDSQVGWKIGATDPAVQAAMGSDSPFTAPVFASTVLRSGETVSLRSFVAPVLEAEIAFVTDTGGCRPAGCIEIADSRFGSWQLSLAQAIADFGLHGAIVVGTPPDSWPDDISVVLSRDGAEIMRSDVTLSTCRESATVQYAQHGDGVLATPYFVATGSVGPPAPLSPGLWRAEFGALGVVELAVRP